VDSPGLKRQLGLWSAIGIVIGVTIGSGIFRNPAVIAGRVPDPALMFSVWVLGGTITLAGALSLAELAAALPQTGGLYVYLREGWGRPVAFLFGWSQLVLIRASAVGGIASVFGVYFLRSFGVDPIAHETAATLVAAAAIAVATAANILGARLGAAIVGWSTVAKYSALALIVGASFLLGGRAGASTAHFTATAAVEPGLYGLALVSVLWAYDGFADLANAAGEIKDPGRNLPRALILGTLAIVGIYLAANAAFLYMHPIDRMAQSPLIAADTLQALVGGIGVSVVSIVVMISTFGALNGVLLVNPRIFFAMADDRLFFPTMATVHPTYHTPYVAILLAGALGTVFVLSLTFVQLTDTFVLAIWPFYAVGVAAIYRLRRTRPDLARPYRVLGYPIVPAVFIGGVVYLLVNALATDPFWTSLVFAAILAGLPVYFALFRQR
jgi:amino acid transporter